MISDKILALLATADIGAYAMSIDQTIMFWNPGAERILGYTPDQVIGRHCFEVVSGLVPGGLTPECQEGVPVHPLPASRHDSHRHRLAGALRLR